MQEDQTENLNRKLVIVINHTSSTVANIQRKTFNQISN